MFFFNKKKNNRLKYGRMALRDRFEDIYKLINAKSPLIIDAGANRGSITDRFLKLYNTPRIHLIEPIPDLAEKLIEKYNGKENIIIHQKALGSENKTISFNVLNRNSSSSILQPSKINHKYHPGEMELSAKIDVEQIKLDELINDEIDIVKLDLQGYELEALKGMENILSKIKLITTEIEFVTLYENQALFAEIDIFLRVNNFRIYNLYELWTHKDGQLTAGDAIYLNNNYF